MRAPHPARSRTQGRRTGRARECPPLAWASSEGGRPLEAQPRRRVPVRRAGTMRIGHDPHLLASGGRIARRTLTADHPSRTARAGGRARRAGCDRPLGRVSGGYELGAPGSIMANAAAAVSYGVRRFIMGGRATHGFIVVAGDTLDETMLEGWITRARAHVAALPPEDTGGTAP